jgi:hypothetical protein
MTSELLEAALWISACLLVPLIWGWLVYRLFIALRLHSRLPGPTHPPQSHDESTATWDYQI